MALLTSLRRSLRLAGRPSAAPLAAETQAPPDRPATTGSRVQIAANDPLLAYLQSSPEPVDLVSLDLDSQAVRDLQAAGVVVIVPLDAARPTAVAVRLRGSLR